MKEVDAFCMHGSMHFCSNNRMDPVSCFPEDINKIEVQKKSFDSIESSVPSSNEIAVQSVIKLCENSVQERAKSLDCNVTISLLEKNCDAANNEVLEEDNINTHGRNKRLKKTPLSELQTTDLEIVKEEAGSPLSELQTTDLEIIEEEAGSYSPGLSQRIGSTSLEQVDLESTREKRVIAEVEIPVEVVEKKLLEEASDCCLSLLIDKSNGSTSDNRDPDILTVLEHRKNDIGFNVVSTDNDIVPSVAFGDGCCQGSPLPLDKKELSESNDAIRIDKESCEANIILNVVSTETDKDIVPSVASGDECCRDSPLRLDNKELSESNDATRIDKDSCEANKVANNPPEELHDVAKETVSNVEVHGVEFAEENLKHSDGLNSVASQNATENINVEVSRPFAGYTGKKLLVLDVNGLLVDISSYVPYDYDPDDIILKKAVFKRPFCDDFLKFCFEKFNVGVWSSRTKRNVEPILDFLLGNDKRKLLFYWDQSHCTNTGYGTVEKRHKPLLLKKLKKLWDKSEPDLPWERGAYNESNTLLLDDTPYKALSNPRYTAIFPYTFRFTDVQDNSLGPGGDLRVYLEGLAMADNVQEYVKQNPFGQRPITEKNLSWGYYVKVIEASSTPPRENEKDDDDA